jgi:hypothetical protein
MPRQRFHLPVAEDDALLGYPLKELAKLVRPRVVLYLAEAPRQSSDPLLCTYRLDCRAVANGQVCSTTGVEMIGPYPSSYLTYLAALPSS